MKSKAASGPAYDDAKKTLLERAAEWERKNMPLKHMHKD